MEINVTTDVTLENEPLLTDLVDSGEGYIFRFIKYPVTGGNTSEVALIKNLCVTVRVLSEKLIEKTLSEKTLSVFWPAKEVARKEYRVALPEGPISSITSLHVLYADGSTATELTEGTDFYVYGDQYKSIQVPKIVGIGDTSAINGYRAVYVAGYGASGCDDMPGALKAIMARQVVEWFSNRGEENADVLSSETRKALKAFTRNAWL